MKRLSFLFLFPLLTVYGGNLEKFFTIQNGYLINYEGQKYSAIEFDSPLHEDLAYTLKDPEQTQIIHDAYQRHIAEIVEDSAAFSKALLKVCYFFGSEKFSPENGFLLALREEGLSEWIDLHREAISRFVQEANQPAHVHRAKEKDQPYTIAILTTSASGGNESVTYGMRDFLSENENIKVVVIDVETIAVKADPIMLATGQTTYDGLYASTFQQAECPDILAERNVLTKNIGKYIPSRLGSMLKEAICEINPDLIISSRSYAVNDVSLSTLDIPFRVIHCDYELSFFMMDLYGKVNPESMKFWLPSFEPRIFKPLFIKANRLDLYDETDSFDQLMAKLEPITGASKEDLKNQFELIGYPIRQEFSRIENSEQLESIRQKWGILADETPILISMGKNGVGVLEKIFDQTLALPPLEKPVKYIFICGKNEELKKRLEKKAPQDRYQIYGFLSPAEMNELMNISPVKITKPGGAMTSEAMVTGTYLLMMEPHPWEEANGAKIERVKYGQYFNPAISLNLQIEECIEKGDIIRKETLEEPDWKKLLLQSLSGCFKMRF